MFIITLPRWLIFILNIRTFSWEYSSSTSLEERGRWWRRYEPALDRVRPAQLRLGRGTGMLGWIWLADFMQLAVEQPIRAPLSPEPTTRWQVVQPIAEEGRADRLKEEIGDHSANSRWNWNLWHRNWRCWCWYHGNIVEVYVHWFDSNWKIRL